MNDRDAAIRDRNASSPLSLDGIEAPPWMREALCAQIDTEIFYPEKGGSTRDAKGICATCPVRAECLAYALENAERYGVWGGLTERERRKLAKRTAA